MSETTQNPIERRLDEMAASYIAQRKIVARPNGQLIDGDGKNVPYDDFARDFNLATADQMGAGLSKENKIDALTRRLDNMSAAAVAAIVDRISYRPEAEERGQQQLVSWLTAVLGYAPQPMDIAVMNHFLWQISRKAHDKPVSYHMMPIFIGKQGTGKSVAIARLLQPIEQLTISGQSVNYITDPNNYKTMGMNLCVFTDEMARCSTVDIDRLKQSISGETLNYRIFHKQRGGFSTQKCTLIGAANKEFRELINDPTGVRRFFEFKCNKPKTIEERQERWGIINSIDVVSIWQSVNENQDAAYILPHYDEIEKKQERMRVPTSIEEWIGDLDLAPGEHKLTLAELYRSYKAHTIDSNRKDIFAKRNFGLSLQDLGFKRITYTNGNVYLLCNKRSLVEPLANKTILNKEDLDV